ncbi:MAG: hypothetical protein LBB56_07645 [Chitinispirillales bacterium]|nr:hypothetical protein [Chitinispirillales bacterium]
MVILSGTMSCSAQVQNKSATPQVQQQPPHQLSTPSQQTQPRAQVQQQPVAPTVQTSQQAAPTTQNKPKVAVYVTGGKTVNENQALGARITHALVSSGKYNTIERSDIFLDQVAKEMTAQRSGAIDDKQISKLGQQAGADFVCIGEMLEAFGAHQISARIVNVVSVEVIASGLASGSLKTMDDLATLSNQVVTSLLGLAQNIAPVSGAVANVNQAALATPVAAQSVTVPVVKSNSNSNTFTDSRDGQVYRTVKIGNKTWMAENLNFRPKTDNTYCYGHDDSNCDKYGRLYTWDAAMTACPAGWYLPNNEDWNDLVWEADGKAAASGRLKSKNGWKGSGNGSDKLGFSALPGGRRYKFNDYFINVGAYGFWWSATTAKWSNYSAYMRLMTYNGNNMREDVNGISNHMDFDVYDKKNGYSVRCVQDQTNAIVPSP